MVLAGFLLVGFMTPAEFRLDQIRANPDRIAASQALAAAYEAAAGALLDRPLACAPRDLVAGFRWSAVRRDELLLPSDLERHLRAG